MRESRFANPHGLPDERNQTSARDMAILARALLREFPEYSDLFHIGAIQFGRRVMRNTNGLIGRYPGADGMKTGFICSSGFNVVASATRNGRHLITVVLGAPSANERTIKAAELFDRGFSSQRELHQSGTRGACRPRPATPAGHALGHLRPARTDAAGRGRPTAVAETDSNVPNLLLLRDHGLCRRCRRQAPAHRARPPRGRSAGARLDRPEPALRGRDRRPGGGRGGRRAGPQGQGQEGDRIEEGQGTRQGHRGEGLGR